MGIRTAAYFLLIAISIVLMTLALKLRLRWCKSLRQWNATLSACVLYMVIVSVVTHFLPVTDDVPAAFQASLLWRFRIVSWETQVVPWITLALFFGWLTERPENGSELHRSTRLLDELDS